MKIVRGELVDRAVDSIRPYPNNPNEGDVGAIAESIEENGWYGRCLVQKSTGYILAGENRWKAAKAMGAEFVPCEVVDVDDEAAERIVLVDNRTNRRGRDDPATLFKLLAEGMQRRGALRGTGYDEDDVNALFARLNGRKKRANKPKPGAILAAIVAEFDAGIGLDVLEDALGKETWQRLCFYLDRDPHGPQEQPE